MYAPPPLDFWLIAGMVVLLLGRHMFWIFISGIWAVAGAELGAICFFEQPGWLQIGAILIGGMTGALLAVFIRPFASAIAGFYAGGSILYAVALHAHYVAGPYGWIPFIVGGITGSILVGMAFDWGLIILSSFYGAALIIQNVHPHAGFTPPFTVSHDLDTTLFFGLAAVGIFFQGLLYKRDFEIL